MKKTMAAPRLTDEELSRVLTAHAAGGLKRAGGYDSHGYPCCIQQARWQLLNLPQGQVFTPVTNWFDHNYEPSWTVEEFLAQLEARGLA